MPDDLQLEHFTKRLGAAAGDRVDPEQTAWAVLARLRREDAHVPWWRKRLMIPAVAVAATVAVVLGVTQPWNDGRGDAAFELPMAASLENLGTDELSQLLDSLATEAPVYELLPADLTDLTENELEVLLENMEG